MAGFSDGALNVPSSPVLSWRAVAPCNWFTITTCAPGIAPPWLSFTAPLRDADDCWAHAAAAASDSAKKPLVTRASTQYRLLGMFSPLELNSEGRIRTNKPEHKRKVVKVLLPFVKDPGSAGLLQKAKRA